MYGFGSMIEVLKKNHKTICFPEGNDPRILEASSRLLASNFLEPILIGNPDEIHTIAEDSGFNIRGAKIIDPNNFEDMDKMVAEFVELRKSKGVKEEQAREILKASNYFGTMLVKMGYADCLLGGAT
jgi:phosphate acetyltransferase